MTRRSLSILALALGVVLAGPAHAQANRAAPRAKSARPGAKAKAAPRAAASPSPAAKAKSPSKRGATLSSRLFARKNGQAPAAKTSQPGMLTKRQMVVDRGNQARKNVKNGRMEAAAERVTASMTRDSKGRFMKDGIAKMTIRERFAMWRAARKVRKASITEAKQRAKAGDVEGTRDALKALEVLEANGKLGIVARWQKRRAENKAFRYTVGAAADAVKTGDGARARELQDFALEIKGEGKKTRSAMQSLSKDSFELASAYAKAGNPAATEEALQMAHDFMVASGVELTPRQANRLNRDVEKIALRAYSNAATSLIKEAGVQYKAKAFDDAAIKLAEARQLGRMAKLDTSRSTRRAEARLVRKLGPRLETVERQLNAAQAAATTGEAAVTPAVEPAAAPANAASNKSEQIMVVNSATR